MWVIIIKILTLSRASAYYLKRHRKQSCDAQRLLLDIWKQSLSPCFEAKGDRWKNVWQQGTITTSNPYAWWWEYQDHHGNIMNPRINISLNSAMMSKTCQFLNCSKESYSIWNKSTNMQIPLLQNNRSYARYQMGFSFIWLVI